MNRKDKKAQEVKHRKLLKQIELKKLTKQNDVSNNLFDYLYDKQTKFMNSSKGLVMGVYQFADLRGV